MQAGFIFVDDLLSLWSYSVEFMFSIRKPKDQKNHFQAIEVINIKSKNSKLSLILNLYDDVSIYFFQIG